MDVPLFGLGVFGGWIVLVVASDVFGILRFPKQRFSTVQTAFLVTAIAAALIAGYFYLQERHVRPCPAPHAHRR